MRSGSSAAAVPKRTEDQGKTERTWQRLSSRVQELTLSIKLVRGLVGCALCSIPPQRAGAGSHRRNRRSLFGCLPPTTTRPARARVDLSSALAAGSCARRTTTDGFDRGTGRGRLPSLSPSPRAGFVAADGNAPRKMLWTPLLVRLPRGSVSPASSSIGPAAPVVDVGQASRVDAGAVLGLPAQSSATTDRSSKFASLSSYWSIRIGRSRDRDDRSRRSDAFVGSP